MSLKKSSNSNIASIYSSDASSATKSANLKKIEELQTLFNSQKKQPKLKNSEKKERTPEKKGIHHKRGRKKKGKEKDPNRTASFHTGKEEEENARTPRTKSISEICSKKSRNTGLGKSQSNASEQLNTPLIFKSLSRLQNFHSLSTNMNNIYNLHNTQKPFPDHSQSSKKSTTKHYEDKQTPNRITSSISTSNTAETKILKSNAKSKSSITLRGGKLIAKSKGVKITDNIDPKALFNHNQIIPLSHQILSSFKKELNLNSKHAHNSHNPCTRIPNTALTPSFSSQPQSHSYNNPHNQQHQHQHQQQLMQFPLSKHGNIGNGNFNLNLNNIHGNEDGRDGNVNMKKISSFTSITDRPKENEQEKLAKQRYTDRDSRNYHPFSSLSNSAAGPQNKPTQVSCQDLMKKYLKDFSKTKKNKNKKS